MPSVVAAPEYGTWSRDTDLNRLAERSTSESEIAKEDRLFVRGDRKSRSFEQPIVAGQEGQVVNRCGRRQEAIRRIFVAQ